MNSKDLKHISILKWMSLSFVSDIYEGKINSKNVQASRGGLG